MFRDFQEKINWRKKTEIEVRECAKKQKNYEDVNSCLNSERLRMDRLKKTLNEPRKIELFFGINLHNRSSDGAFVYNNNRLILMHEPIRTRNADYRGVVAIVNIPYLMLEPTSNKQALLDKKEQNLLISTIGTYMEFYWKHINESEPINNDFWRSYGYEHLNSTFLPNNEKTFKQKRLQQTFTMAQCDQCLKWRCCSWNRRQLEATFPSDDWSCQNNTEVGKNRY